MLNISKKTLYFLLIATTIGLAGSPAAYGAAAADWYGPFDPPIRGGDVWVGVASSVFEIVDVSRRPDRLTPTTTGPDDSGLYNDVVVRATITVTLENTQRRQTRIVTFSGIATYTEAGRVYNHFYLVADGQLITRAFVQLLQDQFADATSPLSGGAFTWADEDPSASIHSNVAARLAAGPAGGLQPGEPLYSSVRIEVQTPAD